MANKYEDIVNLQEVEAYRGARPPTAYYKVIYVGTTSRRDRLCLLHYIMHTMNMQTEDAIKMMTADDYKQ